MSVDLLISNIPLSHLSTHASPSRSAALFFRSYRELHQNDLPSLNNFEGGLESIEPLAPSIRNFGIMRK
jgi:hypothetical protein